MEEKNHKESQFKSFDSFSKKIRNNSFKPVKTGIDFFDELLDGGLMNQSISVLFGAPGTGKTTFVQQLAENFALQKKEVIYFNLEMSTDQMYAKAISNKLNQELNKPVISTNEIMRGYPWDDIKQKRIENAENSYANSSLNYITYNPEDTTNDLESIMNYLTFRAEECMKENKQCPIVFIDFLHLLQSTQTTKIQNILRISLHKLKQYAIQYNTIVFTIAASNRRSNMQGDFTMESGRDSSDIEFCADYVFSLGFAAYDQSNYNPSKITTIEHELSQNPRIMVLKLHKTRWGTIGKQIIDFYPERGFFTKHIGYYNNKRY